MGWNMLGKLWKKKKEPAKTEAELEAKLRELKSSPYARYAGALAKKVSGKTVEDAVGGTSGFVLQFTDKSWVAIYLENGELHYWYGEGECPRALAEIINSSDCGKVGEIGPEVANTRGNTIIGLSIGLNCFNLCFAENRELDMFIAPAEGSKPGLKVGWVKL